MNDWIFNAGLIAALVFILAVFIVSRYKKKKEIRKKYPGYPKGYWMSQGISMGIAIGAGLGVALGNIAIGVPIGVAIGAAIGSELEKKHKDEIRPITDEEKQLRKQSILFVTGIFMLGVIVFILFYFLTG